MQRFKSLDLLRGMAILLVLCTHGFGNSWIKNIGWSGVDLFFLLSGFLIAGLVFSEIKSTGKFRALRFLIRRGFKIYPSFYIFIAFSILFYHYFLHTPAPTSGILTECFFLQNYREGLWPHTWSLGTEEQFYILFAFSSWMMMKYNKSPGTTAFYLPILIVILCTIALLRYVHCLNTNDGGIFFTAHLRGDPIIFGILLAYIQHFKPGLLDSCFERKFVIFILNIICLSPLVFLESMSFQMNVYGLVSIYIGFGLCIISLLRIENSKSYENIFSNLPARMIIFIGKHSYPVYLWHFLIRKTFEGWNPGSVYIQNAVFFCMSIAVGLISSYMIEIPFLKIREKIS